MTPAATTPDPRPQLGAAIDQVQRQVDALGPADLGRGTPCEDYDVRTLIAHLVAVLRKLVVVGNGGDMTTVTDPADDLDDDWRNAFRRARAELDKAWAPDTTLACDYALPWGTVTGHEFLDAYAHEFTVHAWYLSHVSDGGSQLDPALADAALDWYSRNVPAEGRGEGGPFAPALPIPDDADAYTKLAAYLGRPT